MAFDRVCELYVGAFPKGNVKTGEDGDSGVLVKGLDFDFDVLRSVDFFKNRAVIRIYNANEETITRFMSEGKAVILRAGHMDEKVGNIFVGQISESFTDRMQNGDLVTTVICVSQRGAEYALGRVIATVAFPSGTTYHAVLKFIADFAGVPLSGAKILDDCYLEGPYHDVGNVCELVQNFKNSCLLELGGDVIIDNNEMVYIQKVGNVSEIVDGQLVENAGTTTFETLALTLRTGLLSAKKVRKQVTSVEEKFKKNWEYYMGLRKDPKKEDDKDKKEEPAKPSVEIDFKCLISPELAPNLPVYVDNRKIVDGRIDTTDRLGFNGTFMVTEVRFQGDNHGGNFVATCKGAQYGA